MANYKLVTDLSSWNPDSTIFFNALKKQNVKAAIVKLTEGTSYRNPKAKNQIQGAWRAGMYAHGYHYAKFTTVAGAEAEARFFVSTAKSLGLNHTSVLALDVEDPVLNKNGSTLTAQIAAFLAIVKKAGYPLVDVYSSTSWFRYNRILLQQLPKLNLWVASCGVSMPGFPNVGTWQYTSNFAVSGVKVDMSYDFFGHYTARP